MKLLIILCLFSLKSTAQVRVKGISTLTTKNVTVAGVTFKAVGTATTKYFDINKNTIGMPGVQDSVKILWNMVTQLTNEIARLKSDTTYLSTKSFKGKGTPEEPLEVVNP